MLMHPESLVEFVLLTVDHQLSGVLDEHGVLIDLQLSGIRLNWSDLYPSIPWNSATIADSAASCNASIARD